MNRRILVTEKVIPDLLNSRTKTTAGHLTA